MDKCIYCDEKIDECTCEDDSLDTYNYYDDRLECGCCTCCGCTCDRWENYIDDYDEE